MDRGTLKVLTSCALGGFIGTVIAAEVHQYFWWVGLLMGSMIGFLASEYHKIPRAIPIAWEMAQSAYANRERKIQMAKIFGYVGTYVFTFVFGFFALAIACASVTMKVFLGTPGPSFSLIGSISLIMFLVWSAATFIIVDTMTDSWSIERCLTHGRKYARLLNPFSVYFWWIPLGVYRFICILLVTAKELPEEIKIMTVTLCHFVYHLFRLIYSNRGLLCGFGAGIGVVIGHVFNDAAIIGAIAGGIFGLLNYEVVSKGILKIHFNGNGPSSA